MKSMPCAFVLLSATICSFQAGRSQPIQNKEDFDAIIDPSRFHETLVNPYLEGELELTEAQRIEMKELASQFVTDTDNYRLANGVTIAEASRQVAKLYEEELHTLLLPHQLTRLKQIGNQLRIRKQHMQTRGLDADFVIDHLDLTDVQIEEIRQLSADHVAELNDLVHKFREDYIKLRDQSQSAMINVLDEEQRVKHGELFGPPSRFLPERSSISLRRN